MKRTMLSILMFMGLALSASAQKEEIYYYALQDGSFVMREFIDRKSMEFIFDGDSEDDCTMEMRNYKKNGNTETFDIYAKHGYQKGKKKGSITIVTDPNLQITENLDLSKQTITIKDGSYTRKVGFLTEKQNKQYTKLKGGRSGGGDSPTDVVKDKAKDLLDKGKNLFKKKK